MTEPRPYAENARPRGIQWYVGKCWRTHYEGYRQRRLLIVTPWSVRSYPIGPRLRIDGSGGADG